MSVARRRDPQSNRRREARGRVCTVGEVESDVKRASTLDETHGQGIVMESRWKSRSAFFCKGRSTVRASPFPMTVYSLP